MTLDDAQILMGKSYPLDELDELFDSIDTSCDGSISCERPPTGMFPRDKFFV